MNQIVSRLIGIIDMIYLDKYTDCYNRSRAQMLNKFEDDASKEFTENCISMPYYIYQFSNI